MFHERNVVWTVKWLNKSITLSYKHGGYAPNVKMNTALWEKSSVFWKYTYIWAYHFEIAILDVHCFTLCECKTIFARVRAITRHLAPILWPNPSTIRDHRPLRHGWPLFRLMHFVPQYLCYFRTGSPVAPRNLRYFSSWYPYRGQAISQKPWHPSLQKAIKRVWAFRVFRILGPASGIKCKYYASNISCKQLYLSQRL